MDRTAALEDLLQNFCQKTQTICNINHSFCKGISIDMCRHGCVCTYCHSCIAQLRDRFRYICLMRVGCVNVAVNSELAGNMVKKKR